MEYLHSGEKIYRFPLTDFVAAISVGMVKGEALLDLSFEEDSRADVDMNIVMTGGGKLVEIQGTAEGKTFSRQELNVLLDLGVKGIQQLISKQRAVLGKISSKVNYQT
jgi:ribonuclease PH